MTGADVVTEARRWLGVPYVHQGRTRFGVDCIGLVICVRDTLQSWIEVSGEPRDYRRIPKDGLLRERLAVHCEQIVAPEDGAVLLIKWPKSRYASHAGIYAGGNIIHAYQRLGRVVESGWRSHWQRDTESFWRLPGVVA